MATVAYYTRVGLTVTVAEPVDPGAAYTAWLAGNPTELTDVTDLGSLADSGQEYTRYRLFGGRTVARLSGETPGEMTLETLWSPTALDTLGPLCGTPGLLGISIQGTRTQGPLAGLGAEGLVLSWGTLLHHGTTLGTAEVARHYWTWVPDRWY